jgi:predicted nucleic acid-binding protein
VVIVDSTVWIDYYRGESNLQTVWLDEELRRNRLGLTDLILREVLQGTQTEREFSTTLRELSEYVIFNSGGEDLAVASAQNYRYLRSRGLTIRTSVDCLIATFCINNGHSLLHRDRDFEPFETYLGLSVIHPAIH